MVCAFMYGVILAFGLILPLGVQNIFIFNQGSTQLHFLHAMPSVITASICDAILIILAVEGVSVAVLGIPWFKMILYVMGFCFLVYMGFLTWYSTPRATRHAGEKPLPAKQQVMFSLSVSLLNPHALLDTIGVIGTSSLRYIGQEKFAFTFGCILISWCWFFSLSVAGHFLHRLDKMGFWERFGNRISAVIIWIVALFIGMQIIR
jgi:L-lysine exporter family protein LysE/ArgO